MSNATEVVRDVVWSTVWRKIVSICMGIVAVGAALTYMAGLLNIEMDDNAWMQDVNAAETRLASLIEDAQQYSYKSEVERKQDRLETLRIWVKQASNMIYMNEREQRYYERLENVEVPTSLVREHVAHEEDIKKWEIEILQLENILGPEGSN